MENCPTSTDVFGVLKQETNWNSHSSVCNLKACFELLADSDNNVNLSVLFEKLQAIKELNSEPTYVNVAVSDCETLKVAVKTFTNDSPPEKVISSSVYYEFVHCLKRVIYTCILLFELLVM